MSRRDELFELHRRKFEKGVSFVIGEPVPKKQTLPKFKPYIDVSISLKNQSAARSKFRLEGVDRQNICSFEFQDETRQASVARNIELWLSPDEHTTILVRIIPPAAALIGLKKTVYHFTLTSTMLTGKHPAWSVFGSFAVSPLLAEVAYQESQMNPLAIGKDNELGLMQVLPTTWYEWSPKVGVSDPFDRYSNVLVGAAYLAYVRDYAQSKGYHNEYWMLVGYNWGPNNLKQLFDQKINAIPGQQHQYATDILQAVSTGKSRWRKNTP